MGTNYQTIIDDLLNKAERNRQCLARPENPRLRRALSYRATRSKLYSPYRGIYIRNKYWDGLSRFNQVLHMTKALSQLHPTWVFDGYTAATIRGWDVPYHLLGDIQIVMPYRYRSESLIARADKDSPFEIVNGMRVAPIGKTLHQCLKSTDLRAALAIADSALRKSRLTNDKAIELLRNDPLLNRSWHLQRTLEVLRYADPRSESGGESIARATMILLGFDIPELQVEYLDPMNPGKVIRVDFRWILEDGTVILGELDGKQKYIDLEMTRGRNAIDVLTDERLRESRLSITGARILRFSYDDVCDTAYFTRLLDGFGVPRDSSRAISPKSIPSLRGSGTYDEMPPLECYEDLIATRGIN